MAIEHRRSLAHHPAGHDYRFTVVFYCAAGWYGHIEELRARIAVHDDASGAGAGKHVVGRAAGSGLQLSERVGTCGGTRLPEAMERDSEAATRTINQFQSGNPQQTTESLLREIAGILRELDRKATPESVVEIPG